MHPNQLSEPMKRKEKARKKRRWILAVIPIVLLALIVLVLLLWPPAVKPEEEKWALLVCAQNDFPPGATIVELEKENYLPVPNPSFEENVVPVEPLYWSYTVILGNPASWYPSIANVPPFDGEKYVVIDSAVGCDSYWGSG